MRKIIASLDIGSNTIKLVVGEYIKNALNILCVAENPSKGIKKGIVENKEEAISSIKETFHKAEEMLGLPVKEVILNIPAYDMQAFMSEGLTTITNEDKIVTNNDLIRCMSASVYNKIENDRELVSILPTGFKINDNEVVKNPLNMNAEKLITKSVIITSPKVLTDKLTEILNLIGVKVLDIVISPLGDYYANRKKKMLDKTGAVINIGEDITTVSIFNKGILTRSEVIDLGGKNVDNDIAYIYKITKNDAHELKESIGLATSEMASEEEKKSLTDRLGNAITISEHDLSKIIESRLTEILELAKKQINLLTNKNIEYVIVTGGTTEIRDFNILLDKVFTNTHILGKIENVGVRNNKYATVIGNIKYYNSRLKLRNIAYSVFNEDDLEILSGNHKKVNINENSILGKIFGYFFDS